MRINLENRLEKLARLLSRQYNVNVVFQGNQAKTDGKTVFLPYFSEITPELFEDLNGYLDHEVSHVKFTDFTQYAKSSHFHQKLLNGVEDVRIERLMIKEYPGCELNLGKLNEKLIKNIKEKWSEYPWPVRFIFSVMFTMEGRELVEDKEIERHLNTCEPEIKELNSCKSTKELLLLTKKIVDKLKMDREEEKQESKKGEKNSENGEGEKSKEPVSKEEKQRSKAKEKSDEMIADDFEEDKAEGETSFDELQMDVHDLINGQVQKMVEKEEKEANSRFRIHHNREINGVESFASTTKYDVVEDFSGRQNGNNYARLREQVRSIVTPLRLGLEKIFKTIENSRWKTEREQGLINPRALSRLASSPNYTAVFKEQVKTVVDTVAVEILCDLSGSMGGKMDFSKQCVTALGEALKGLGLNFEITGFSTAGNGHFDSSTRFNRQEALYLAIFKDFNCTKLDGISFMRSIGSNHDGESVMWAAKRLAERKEKRKVLIVLSDGQPAGSCHNSDYLQSDLRYKLNKITKGGIEAVGIGIQTDAVKYYYKDYVIVNDLKDLTSVALKTLSGILLKGQKY